MLLYAEEAAYLIPAPVKHSAGRDIQHWIHPFLHDGLIYGMFVISYPKLKDHEDKIFSYFRMSMKSFDDLLEQMRLAGA